MTNQHFCVGRFLFRFASAKTALLTVNMLKVSVREDPAERSAGAGLHPTFWTDEVASVAARCLASVSTGAGAFVSVVSASVARQALFMLKARGPELLID